MRAQYNHSVVRRGNNGVTRRSQEDHTGDHKRITAWITRRSQGGHKGVTRDHKHVVAWSMDIQHLSEQPSHCNQSWRSPGAVINIIILAGGRMVQDGRSRARLTLESMDLDVACAFLRFLSRCSNRVAPQVACEAGLVQMSMFNVTTTGMCEWS